jgi:hypothetical protein
MEAAMPVFKNDEHVYTVMRHILNDIAQHNPGAFDETVKNRLTVHFKLSAPPAEFTIDGKSRPPKLTYGAGGGRPDIDLDLNGDNLDRLLKHEISASKAVTDGTIKFKGNPFKLRALLDVIKACNPVYLAMLASQPR